MAAGKPYPPRHCVKCNNTVSYFGWSEHERRVHRARVNFACSECPAIFKSVYTLRDHVNVRHEVPRQAAAVVAARALERAATEARAQLEAECDRLQQLQQERETELADLRQRLNELDALPGEEAGTGRGGCCLCGKRAGRLNRCAACRRPVHFVCTGLWFVPRSDLVFCPACRDRAGTTAE